MWSELHRTPRGVSAMVRTPGEGQHARWRLVVAVDGSEGSREALLWTARLARVMKAEVVAIHTVERPALRGRLCAVGVGAFAGRLGRTVAGVGGPGPRQAH